MHQSMYIFQNKHKIVVTVFATLFYGVLMVTMYFFLAEEFLACNGTFSSLGRKELYSVIVILNGAVPNGVLVKFLQKEGILKHQILVLPPSTLRSV